ncbi:MAG TPA: MFS transporter, partial [Rhizomicrobium sp.]
MSDAGRAQLGSFRTKFFYGLGSAAFGLKNAGFNSLLGLYYNQVVGMPADLVGFAIFLALVIDAFIDPVIGHISDNLRTPWGRRHPF